MLHRNYHVQLSAKGGIFQCQGHYVFIIDKWPPSISPCRLANLVIFFTLDCTPQEGLRW